VANGYASITPLQIDMSAYKSMDRLQQWLEGIRL
jgi:5'-nucleotidase